MMDIGYIIYNCLNINSILVILGLLFHHKAVNYDELIDEEEKSFVEIIEENTVSVSKRYLLVTILVIKYYYQIRFDLDREIIPVPNF